MGNIKKIKAHLATLSECTKDALSDLRCLEGKSLDEFKDIFDIEADVFIFYNEYNIVLIDPISHEAVSPYLKPSDMVLRLEIPEHECNLWVYQYFNERIFNDYLKP